MVCIFCGGEGENSTTREHSVMAHSFWFPDSSLLRFLVKTEFCNTKIDLCLRGGILQACNPILCKLGV